MNDYSKYVLVIAITVFVIFTVLFSVMIAAMTKFSVKLIRYGDDDETIIKKRKYIEKKLSKPSVASRVFSAVFASVLLVLFVLILCISSTNNRISSSLSNIRIVKSESMSFKNEKNEYLFENGLNDQFSMFDVVITEELPPEEDIKPYDIVVYERDKMLIIHRVISIDEPNSKHSDRYFYFQGDALSSRDSAPVLYSQMRAIYRGERIPFVGSIILFIQSPAGWLCFILIMFAILITPIVEKKLLYEMSKRLSALIAAGGFYRSESIRRSFRTRDNPYYDDTPS